MAGANPIALPTVGPLSGAALISGINTLLRILEQCSLGDAAPSVPYLGKLWVDNTVPTLLSLKIYDGTTYCELGKFSTATHLFTATNSVLQTLDSFTTGTPVLADYLLWSDIDSLFVNKRMTISDLFALMPLGSLGLGVNYDISSTNLDVLDKTGFYRGASLTNAPAASSASFTIIHMKIDATAASQYASRVTTGDSYIRTKTSSVWGSWRKIDYTLATAAQIRAGSDNIAPVTSNGIWSAIASAAVAWASTVTLDFSAGENFTIGQMTGNTILANPTNRKSFQKGTIVFTQDATGGRTLGFGSAFTFPSEIPFVIDTTAKAVSLLHYECWDTSYVYISGVRRVKTLP